MIKGMRWRSVVAALMVILLMAAPSWASACDTVCVLHSALADCHPFQASTTSQKSVQATHSHCIHTENSAASNTASVSFTSDLGCHHTLCHQPESVFVPTGDVLFGNMEWAIIGPALIPETGSIPELFASQMSPPFVDVVSSRLPLSLRI
jgi:hypothetical protein